LIAENQKVGKAMSKFVLPGAVMVIILSAAVAPPALAQAANAEPGYCAQFYPNSDCNSVGPDTPGKPQGEAVENEASEAAPVPPAKPAKQKKPVHRSASTAGITPKTGAVAK
jgi:hypothetical protein